MVWDLRNYLHRLVRGMVLCDECRGSGDVGSYAAVCCDSCGGYGEVARGDRRADDRRARELIGDRLDNDRLRRLARERRESPASARVARQVLRRRLWGLR
jgi:RecJ-like exonuclease